MAKNRRQFLVPMNLAQALIVLEACESQRKEIGLRTIEQVWTNITDEQLDWTGDHLPEEALPEHICHWYTRKDTGTSYDACPRCNFFDMEKKTYKEFKAYLTPWLPNIARRLDEELRFNYGVTLDDPLMKKRPYKKRPAKKKAVAKKGTPKKIKDVM